MPFTRTAQSQHDYELYEAWEVWKQRSSTPNTAQMPRVVTQNRGNVKTMARALYRQLRKDGVTRREVVTLATELIDLITNDLRRARSRRAA